MDGDLRFSVEVERECYCVKKKTGDAAAAQSRLWDYKNGFKANLIFFVNFSACLLNDANEISRGRERFAERDERKRRVRFACF
jgi:hypothetical protein